MHRASLIRFALLPFAYRGRNLLIILRDLTKVPKSNILASVSLCFCKYDTISKVKQVWQFAFKKNETKRLKSNRHTVAAESNIQKPRLNEWTSRRRISII